MKSKKFHRMINQACEHIDQRPAVVGNSKGKRKEEQEGQKWKEEKKAKGKKKGKKQ